MSADQYLAHILQRETVNTGPLSPVRGVLKTLTPILQVWGGQYFLHATPSGSFAKGTAIRSGTDIDIFISLAENTPDTLREIYYLLKKRMVDVGYQPKEQNVSIKTRVGNYDVDLVPGTRQHWYNTDHSLYTALKSDKAATMLLFELISRLQLSATVPMIDVRAYSAYL